MLPCGRDLERARAPSERQHYLRALVEHDIVSLGVLAGEGQVAVLVGLIGDGAAGRQVDLEGGSDGLVKTAEREESEGGQKVDVARGALEADLHRASRHPVVVVVVVVACY